ncbi:MAG: ABC transporter substrate-binding protein [Chloroflexales bacterium]|nr:ABC transporter substrate-binding protein [Chloroflexales bacterium]
MRTGIRGLAFLLCLLSIWACQTPTTWQEIVHLPTPLPRGGRVTIAVPDDVTTVVPWQVTSRASELFVSLTHSGLMRLDDHGAPQPELLADWNASSDGRVLTATLQADLKWSDATPLTSADVVFTYTTLKSLVADTPVLAELHHIIDVRAIDLLHVKFTLDAPYSPLLTLWALPILPKNILASQSIAQINLRNLTTTAGPFTYKNVSTNGVIVLVANPNYVHGMPLIDELAIMPNSRDSDMIAGIRNGTIDIAELQEAPLLSKTNPVSNTMYPQNIFGIAAFNMRQDHLFADRALRLAVQQAMSQTTTLGMMLPQTWVDKPIATPATALISDARSLLDNAGWDTRDSAGIRQKSGVSLQATVLAPDDNPLLLHYADQYTALLKSLDIAVVRHTLPHAAYVAQLIPPYDFDIALLELGNGRSSSTYADTWLYDPDQRALLYGGDRNQGAPDVRGSLNIAGFADSSYDQASDSAMKAYDINARGAALVNAAQRTRMLAPYVVLYRPTTTVIYGRRLRVLTGSLRFDTPWYSTNAMRWFVQP